MNKNLIRNVLSNYLKTASEEDQLEKGIEVEKEHTDVYELMEDFLKKHDLKMPLTRKEFFEMVAKAHIKEVKDYYDKLIKHVEKHAMDFSSITPLLEPGSPMDDRELVRAIRLSISAEEDAVSLYELIADSTKDKDIKRVVQDIANEEKVHSGEFARILMKLDENEKELLTKGLAEAEEKLKK
jgi:rubrerythrin